MHQNTCFILMPFSKAPGLEKTDLDYIYEHILKKAVSTYLKNDTKYFTQVERFENKVGSIISGIVNNLNTAELVIADLTGLNPNVMYELGVRHALRRGTIIITQDLGNLPSDLRDYLTVEYKYSKETTKQPDLFNKFENELHKSIDEVLSTNKYDSPVLSYLQQKQLFRNETELEKLKSEAVIIQTIIDNSSDISDLIEDYEESHYSDEEEILVTQLFNLKLQSLAFALHELNIPYNNSVLHENLVYSKTILAQFEKSFHIQESMAESLGDIPDIPPGVLGRKIKNSVHLNKKVFDLFTLQEEDTKIVLITMKDFFKKGGRLEVELFDYLEEYVESKAKSLGLDKEEIDALYT